MLQNGLRKQAVDIIKTAAQCDFSGAIALSEKYLKQVSLEKERAEEAIRIARDLIEEKILHPIRFRLPAKKQPTIWEFPSILCGTGN